MSDNRKILFRKIGGTHQFSIDSPEDLRTVAELDEALWMCVSAPVDSFICDPAFTKFLDTDGNGRIRADEVREGLNWLFDVLADITVLADPTPELPLAAIDAAKPLGKTVAMAAERILSNIGADDKTRVSLEQARSRQDILASGECNGDGVIPAASIDDTKLRAFVEDVMATIGSDTDAGGGKGVCSERVERFMSETRAYLKWLDEGAASKVMVWGEETVSAYAALKTMETKIDGFFRQCDLAAAAPEATVRFRADETAVSALNVNDLSAMDAFLAAAPLATPCPEGILILDSNVNPHYSAALDELKAKVLKRFLKSRGAVKQLAHADWERLKDEFAAFAEWDAGKPETPVERLGEKRLREAVESDAPKRLKPLFDKDLAVANEIEGIEGVEKLILFKANMLEFCENFVSFASLLDPISLSMIQAGRLVMDGRRFELNMGIADRGAHKKTAELSDICVMYLKLTSIRNGAKAEKEVATAVTSGDVANLRIGKRGLFITRDGSEWDAEVVDFISRPVSIAEALKSPFVKLGAFLKRRTEKITASSYGKVEKGLDKGLDNVGNAVATPPATAKRSAGTPAWAGPLMLLGGGIGLAGLGSAFASVMNALKDNAVVLRIFLFAVGLVLIVAIPIVVSAVMKLRRRNIGMFLEAEGWAMNAPMRLTRKMGLLFTREPDLPPNAEKCLFDHTRKLLEKAGIKSKSGLRTLLLIVATALAAIAAGYALNRLLDLNGKVEKTLFPDSAASTWKGTDIPWNHRSNNDEGI